MKNIIIISALVLALYAQLINAGDKHIAKQMARLSLSTQKEPVLPAFYTIEDGWCRVYFTNSRAVISMSKRTLEMSPQYMNLPYGPQSPK